MYKLPQVIVSNICKNRLTTLYLGEWGEIFLGVTTQVHDKNLWVFFVHWFQLNWVFQNNYIIDYITTQSKNLDMQVVVETPSFHEFKQEDGGFKTKPNEIHQVGMA